MENTEVTTEEQQKLREEIKTMRYTELLTEEQIKKCQEAFSKFDIYGNGTISSGEINQILENLGHNPKDKDIKIILSEFDSNRNSVLDFEEFCQFYSQFELRDAFCNIKITEEQFEKLMNEQIEQTKLKQEIHNMDYNELLTEEQIKECQEVFAKFGVNGKISREEISKILENLGQNQKDGDIKKIFDEFDLDENEGLDLEKFCLFYAQFELKDAFCNIKITEEEFEKLMNKQI